MATCRSCNCFHSSFDRRQDRGWAKLWQAAHAPRMVSFGILVSSIIRFSARYMTGSASCGARPCDEERDLTIARDSSGVIARPFNRTIRLIACDQPSGVVRTQLIRDKFPLASGAWQVPHFSLTSASATGIPGSLSFISAPSGPPSACANRIDVENSASNPNFETVTRFTPFPPQAP